jgi:hypothetical protein
MKRERAEGRRTWPGEDPPAGIRIGWRKDNF